jgi:IclR family acetate operon transcriptional repressor
MSTSRDEARPPAGAAGGVQSLHRALDILETLASYGGNLSVADMATATSLPMPTAHRLIRTLVERGYVRQLPNRTYALGFRLLPLAAVANTAIGAGAMPILSGLVAELGETANLAVLAATEAEYIAQVPSKYTMRTFTEVGRRVELHSTGVGKALLAQLDGEAVEKIIDRRGLGRRTEHTITTRVALLAELDTIRQRGYALDEQEQEIGVRCIAAPLPSDTMTWMAVSVSGPLTRMDDKLIERAAPILKSAAIQLAEQITEAAPPRSAG